MKFAATSLSICVEDVRNLEFRLVFDNEGRGVGLNPIRN